VRMNLTRYQIQTLYWLSEERELSSLHFRSKSLSFKPCLALEKLGLIGITGNNSCKVARIEHQGDLIVRKLKELSGKYLLLDSDSTMKLLIRLVKRLELGQVNGFWIVVDKSHVGNIRVTPLN
jgi:hypothetical protein